MGDLYVSIYPDYWENELVLATDKASSISFSTQLPGGFAEGSFTLPRLFFNPVEWQDKLLGRHVNLSSAAGELLYQGTVDGVEDTDDGLQVQLTGYYAKAALKIADLIYPTAPVNLRLALRELSSLVPSWRSTYMDLLSSVTPYTSPVPYDFTVEFKVQEAIEKILKENTAGVDAVQFGVYENMRPMLFHTLTPWYKVSKYDLSLRYGTARSLSGTYNKLRVTYDKESVKYPIDYFEDLQSQRRYGVREGVMTTGAVEPGVAQVAGELAITRYAKPDEQENLSIHGQIRRYETGVPVPVWMLTAGHLLFVTDLPANPENRFAFSYDRDQAGYLVMRTTYTHDTQELTLDVGDGAKTLEQYLEEIEVSGGSVK